MSRREAAWIAWSLCALASALTALSVVLLALNFSQPDTPIYDFWLENTVFPVSFSVIGAIIASRLPANPVGWLFCAAALISAVAHFSAEYATYALLARPGSLPAGVALGWLAYWVWILFIGCLALSLLLFPNGRLPPGKGWRWLAWLVVLSTTGGAAWLALSPGPMVNLGAVRNPLGIEGLPNGYEPVQTIVFALLFVATVSTLVLRLRRATGIERQQIKWPAYTAVIATGSSVLQYNISDAVGLPWLEWAAYVVSIAALVGFPISLGVAIARYRLYDIDVIINRSLVYGLLSAMLVTIYFGGVAVIQVIFRILTGQQQQPQLAIVVSTLVIAALFNPLRRRIQSFIDRRFYRSKYDAQETLEAFSSKLRDETDLDALGKELVGVVRETMQPAHASLWLRSFEVGRRPGGNER
ncbi:MAG: hypothetical protein ACR2FR_01045 [Rubrobacter sp.]